MVKEESTEAVNQNIEQKEQEEALQCAQRLSAGYYDRVVLMAQIEGQKFYRVYKEGRHGKIGLPCILTKVDGEFMQLDIDQIADLFEAIRLQEKECGTKRE